MNCTIYSAAGDTLAAGLEDPRHSAQAVRTALDVARRRRETVLLEIGDRTIKIGPQASFNHQSLRAVRIAHKGD